MRALFSILLISILASGTAMAGGGGCGGQFERVADSDSVAEVTFYTDTNIDGTSKIVVDISLNKYSIAVDGNDLGTVIEALKAAREDLDALEGAYR